MVSVVDADNIRMTRPWMTTALLKRLARNSNIVWFFLALGVLLRLRQYLFNRSLWLDESLLVLNLITRTPSELLKPLEYHQGAPLGFLMLEKTVMSVFGSGEMALRLIPFLAGIASLFLFAAVARRFLAPEAVPVAVALFSTSGLLIYYSGEAKQYSTDVVIALILLLTASHLIEGQSSPPRTFTLSTIAGVAIWFSQPAAFVVASIGITWFWFEIRKRDGSFPVRSMTFGAIACLSNGIYYVLSLRNLLNDQSLMRYWNGAFAPLPYSLSRFRWFINTWSGICENPVGLTFVGIATAATVLGAREIFRGRRERLLLLTLPVLLALLASALHRYPFRGRLLLFVVPSVLLLIGEGLWTIRSNTQRIMPGLGTLLVVLLVYHPLLASAQDLFKPRGVEEIRPVLEYVQKHRSDADILYCYYDAEWALKYYSFEGKIRPIPLIVGVEARQDWKKYRQDLDRLRGDARVWILFSHVYREGGVDEERYFLDYLDGMGTRLDDLHAVGASVYLYDLRTR